MNSRTLIFLRGSSPNQDRTYWSSFSRILPLHRRQSNTSHSISPKWPSKAYISHCRLIRKSHNIPNKMHKMEVASAAVTSITSAPSTEEPSILKMNEVEQVTVARNCRLCKLPAEIKLQILEAVHIGSLPDLLEYLPDVPNSFKDMYERQETSIHKNILRTRFRLESRAVLGDFCKPQVALGPFGILCNSSGHPAIPTEYDPKRRTAQAFDVTLGVVAHFTEIPRPIQQPERARRIQLAVMASLISHSLMAKIVTWLLWTDNGMDIRTVREVHPLNERDKYDRKLAAALGGEKDISRFCKS